MYYYPFKQLDLNKSFECNTMAELCSMEKGLFWVQMKFVFVGARLAHKRNSKECNFPYKYAY